MYKGSPYRLLKVAFPDFPWRPWLFKTVPDGYFDAVENRTAYVEWLMEIVSVKRPSDLRYQHFRDHHGASLLMKYHGSPQLFLDSLNPNTYSNTNTPQTRKNFWESIDNQRKFMDELAAEIGVKDSSDLSKFYAINNKDVIARGGVTLLNRYDNSLYKLLVAIYPEFDWLPWKFTKTPKALPFAFFLPWFLVFTSFDLESNGKWGSDGKGVPARGEELRAL